MKDTNNIKEGRSNFFKALKEKKRIILLLLLIVGAGGAFILQGKYKAANPDTPYEIVYADEHNLIKTISVSGEVVSENEVNLGSNSSGLVTALYGKVGQRVSKGDLIARVENSAQKAQLTQSLGALQAAQARVESSEVSLSKIKKGAREEQIKILEATVKAAKDESLAANKNAHNVLLSTYATVNQNIIHGTDTLFRNPSKYNPKIDFTLSDSDLRAELSAERIDIRYILDRQEESLTNLDTNTAISNEIVQTMTEIKKIKLFYDKLLFAIDEAVLPDAASAGYANIVGPARSTMINLITTLTATDDALKRTNNNIAIAQANLNQALAGAQKEDINVAQVGVQSAKAAVVSAGGTYKAAKSALDKTAIYSPINGVIVDIYKEVGEFVSGSVPIVKISSKNKYVSALVSEVDIAKVSEGMEVSIALDAFKGKEFKGNIDFIYPDKQEVFGIVYYEIRVSFTDDILKKFTILPGMSLDVIIPYENKENILSIKRIFVKKEDQQYFVYILNPNKEKPIDDKFIALSFDHGFIGDEYIEIISGITKETEIVVFLDNESKK